MHRLRPINLILLVGLLTVAFPAHQAFAQETADTAPDAEAAAPDGAGGEEAPTPEDEIFEEIVVTGGLIEDTLQDTPESVSVWNFDALTDAGVTELQDVFNQTANAYPIANGEGFGIRGINHTSIGTGGIGELGSYYVDGVALTGLAKRVGSNQLWDVEQIEILRGPQTTNVGRNALAGAIVLATKSPSFINESKWRVGYGEDNTWEAAGMVNVPVNDHSAFRFTAETWNTDSFVTNPTRGDDEFDQRENLTLRMKYLYQPESRSNFSMLLSAQYGDNRRGDDIVDLAFGGDRINLSNIETFVENQTLVLSADMRWELNDRWAMRSITSVLDSDYLQVGDTDRLPTGDDARSVRDSVDDNWAQDLRFEFNNERSRGVLGLYYTEVEVSGVTDSVSEVAASELGIPPSLAFLYPESVGIALNSPFDIVTTNFAAFGHWDWEINDRWRAFAGLRWDNEELDTFESVTTTPAPGTVLGLPDPALLPPPISGIVDAINNLLLSQAGTSVNDTETDYEELLPEGGVSYEVNENVTTSLFYKRGYRAGGATVTLVGRFNEFGPETLDLMEFSVRSSALDRRLTVQFSCLAHKSPRYR
ncbi:MAG: TonB-dependent receptor [Acidobacteriota bacterium]